MAPVQATWHLCSSSVALQRSSHNINVVGNNVYVFGGELEPRQPKDNNVYQVSILATTDYSDNASEVVTSSTAPQPRVGSASAVLGGAVYFFSGRGGTAMAPIEESGAFWVFDTANATWSSLPPSNASEPFPPARSYHCATSDGKETIYIHAGCPESGRLSDLWSFNITSRSWKQHADAPAPPRGGPSIAFHNGLLYRMNGFDGKKEQGGLVDVYTPASDTWDIRPFSADGESGPAPRSVGALLPVSVEGRTMLITLFGEGDPSSLGHAGAGKMFSDIWAYDIQQASWQIVRATAGSRGEPAPRGWFAASRVDDATIAIAGGLAESNDRLNDCWLLRFA